MLGYIILGLLAVGLGVLVFSPWLKGFRTQIAAALTAFIGGVLPLIGDAWRAILPYSYDVVGYLKDLDWRQYLTAQMVPYVMIGIGVIFYILRRMTTGPVGTKV
jgi:hypothetical protein